jgi:hypothetical protein
MRWLIESYTETGDLIVDPYAGSCATLLAASLEQAVSLERGYCREINSPIPFLFLLLFGG